MRKKESPLVIAIAGVSGGGKTAVTACLTQELHNSKALYFDDYDFDGPEDIIKWVENGSDYNLWDLTPLIRDFEVLCNQGLNYIVLDFPFAYKHFKTSKFIDLAVFIDTPLDIALARRITRDFKTVPAENILFDMENYISQGRKGYIQMLNAIKPDSDIIIDGTQSISEIVNHICEQVG
ncbi:hypothetical protein [Lentibacillus sediminis]|uniref:hypothetical protein n=1 Tax=Lentibacillus sediminis TaxID=1940529 RepID=UPI000C1C18EF|nr:hypothetical protein [Lentibacillus sediminis]